MSEQRLSDRILAGRDEYDPQDGVPMWLWDMTTRREIAIEVATLEAKLEVMWQAAQAVLGQTINGLPIAQVECMCVGDAICPFHLLEKTLADAQEEQEDD